MRSVRVMSIIGICWFSLCFFFISFLIEKEAGAAAGWGVLSVLYGIALSIVVLVNSGKAVKKKTFNSVSEELLKLNELKEKQVISETEFNVRKAELLELSK